MKHEITVFMHSTVTICICVLSILSTEKVINFVGFGSGSGPDVSICKGRFRIGNTSSVKNPVLSKDQVKYCKYKIELFFSKPYIL
jgi:hypothetical protein